MFKKKSASVASITASFITSPSLKDFVFGEIVADPVWCYCRSLTFGFELGSASWFVSPWTFCAGRAGKFVSFVHRRQMLYQVTFCGQICLYITIKQTDFKVEKTTKKSLFFFF